MEYKYVFIGTALLNSMNGAIKIVKKKWVG
jgi:hypothetical protein